MNNATTPPAETGKQVHPIYCTRTGLLVGSLTVVKVAGHIPYLSQWKESQALHPLFSMGETALLNFAKASYSNFCELTPAQAADPLITDKQEQLLRISALAMLHQLSTVHQSTVWMPSLAAVYQNWSSLLQLCYWKNYLESKRFKFPELRISKNNNGIDLTGYIQECWRIKKTYEGTIKELVEQEQMDLAEDTMRVLRGDLERKVPKSKKLLWRWFIANMPAKYSKDLAGWMWELFDAETEQELAEYTIADIDLFEETVLCEVPTGSVISSAFLARISAKRLILETKFKAFEILVPQMITAGVEDGSISMEMPTAASHPNKVQLMIAMAKWKLAHTNQTAHRDAAVAKQQQTTVANTYTPNLEMFFAREAEESAESEDLADSGLDIDIATIDSDE